MSLFLHKCSYSSFFGYPQSMRLRICRNRWFGSACLAVGDGVDDAFREAAITGSQNGSVRFGSVDAEITQETIDFFVSDAEGDPDQPSDGYSSIEQALGSLRQGKFLIVVDDDNRGIEGNRTMAAALVRPADIAVLMKHESGVVSVGMKEEDLERLKLPLMLPEGEDGDSSALTFTITMGHNHLEASIAHLVPTTSNRIVGK